MLDPLIVTLFNELLEFGESDWLFGFVRVRSTRIIKLLIYAARQSRRSFSFRLSSFFFASACVFVSKMDVATRLTIWDLPTTEKTAMEFLQKCSVVQEFRNCARGHAMKLVESVSRAPYWYCPKSGCRSQIGLRTGNWLEGSRLQFPQVRLF
jgi:hypothetical protein